MERMTREEAIYKAKHLRKVHPSICIDSEDFWETVITALEQEPCGDAISRQAVDTLVDELARAISDERCCMSRGRSTATIMQDILDLPSVTPQQRSGWWIPTWYNEYADGNPVYNWWECSECGWEHTGDEESLTAFCPNCGTKMEVEE